MIAPWLSRKGLPATLVTGRVRHSVPANLSLTEEGDQSGQDEDGRKTDKQRRSIFSNAIRSPGDRQSTRNQHEPYYRTSALTREGLFKPKRSRSPALFLLAPPVSSGTKVRSAATPKRYTAPLRRYINRNRT
jgi:hypothetical protein